MGRACVIGHGSIGQRHKHVLAELGFSVTIVSRRAQRDEFPTVAPDLFSAFSAGPPDYVVIATETARHSADLAEVLGLGFSGPILVEKPLFAHAAQIDDAPLSEQQRERLYVAYQLRFDPLIRRLKAEISDAPILTASFYVGQHLDLWRTGRLGAHSYSGRKADGGGALRDLSHELDLADWLFGPCRQVAACGARLGNVTVDSDDAWSILARHDRCKQVTIQMNYLDRIGQRTVTVISANKTVHANLVSGAFTVNGATDVMQPDRNITIRAMHEAVLAGGRGVCDFASAQRTMAVIAQVERAADRGAWETI